MSTRRIYFQISIGPYMELRSLKKEQKNGRSKHWCFSNITDISLMNELKKTDI
jgi:hypothetical protein